MQNKFWKICLLVALLTFPGVGMVEAEPHLENLRLVESEDILGNSFQPIWSYDGRKLAFEKNSADSEDKRLFIADLTKDPLKIKEVKSVKTESTFFFKSSKARENFYDLSWAPNGSSRYVYTASTTLENQDIYVSGVGRVTANPRADGQPAWSPDNKYIAFVSSRAGKGDIYIFDPYALELDNLEKNKIRLTLDPVSSSFFPTWSPDGARLAYVSHFEANDDIYVLNKLQNPTRRDHKRLTQWESSEINPSWSPDGARLAFYSDHNHPKEFSIFIMPADGSAEAVEIATNIVKQDRRAPTWCADGEGILYVLSDPDTFNPIYMVETTPPYKKTMVKSSTQMNSDISLVTVKGKSRIAFVAQGKEADRKKRWMRVYVADLVY